MPKINKPSRTVLYSPCPHACGHDECREWNKVAEAICSVCNEPIGYENEFFEFKRDVRDPIYWYKGYRHIECQEKYQFLSFDI